MRLFRAALAALAALQVAQAWAGQVPGAAAARDIPVNHRDRVYAAEQFSNTVSVTDPADNQLLGVIRLGDPAPGNLSPLYRGQLLVHGLGFSPDRRTLVVVSIGSNSVAFIDTATNSVKHITYVGRAPHEASFTPDGQEVWVTVRGENYVSVLDPHTSACHRVSRQCWDRTGSVAERGPRRPIRERSCRCRCREPARARAPLRVGRHAASASFQLRASGMRCRLIFR